MSELRRGCKYEVIARGVHAQRDLVSVWAYRDVN